MSGMSGFGGSASVLAAVGNSSVNLAAAGEIATPRVPDKKFKVGGLSATIWRGVSEKGMAYFSVQLSKSYKDKDNNWKTTDSFKDYEVPKAMVLLQKAYEYVISQQSNSALN